MDELIDALPLLGAVIYPQTVTPLAVAHPDAVRLLDGEGGGPRRVVALTLRDPLRRPETVGTPDCFDTGCISLVHRLLRLPDGSLRVAVEGLERVALLDLAPGDGHLRARVRPAPDLATPAQPALAEAAARLRAHVEALAAAPPGVSPDLLAEIAAEEDLGRLSYLLAGPLMARAPLAERQRLLATASPAGRLELLVGHAGELPAPPPPLAPAPIPRLDPGRALWLRQGRQGFELAIVEAARLPDDGDLIITGQPGRAARDAALIARTWLLGQPARLGQVPAAGLHLHIPPGAARDDRPGAGAPLALAMAGLLGGRGARADAALVGELGLHGHLLPAGRLRERLAAARELGLTALAVAAGHAEELAALPDELREGLELALVERLDEALGLLL